MLQTQDKIILASIAKTIRGLSIDAIEAANSGHPGLPLGCAEIAAYLFGKGMKYNPKNPSWLNRDRFVLSAGHGSMLFYASLYLAGYDYTLEDLKQFRQLNSKTPGHPEYGEPGVETTTGPLGQGLATAVGLALGNKIVQAHFGGDETTLLDGRIYVLTGDGCMMEGIASEASSFAGHMGLDNLIMIYDANQICLDGPISECFTEDVGKRYEAYGWQVLKISGHDFDEIDAAITTAKSTKGGPPCIIATTTIGLGSPKYQGSNEAHGKALGAEEIKAVKDYHHIPQDPLFHVPSEVTAYFLVHQQRGQAAEQSWKERLVLWMTKNPEKAVEWQIWDTKKEPSNLAELIEKIEMKSGIPTRKSSNIVLQVLSRQLPYLIGGSADLSSSDNTFLEGRGLVGPAQYNAQNIKYGVREFAMGAITSGLALHGMFLPFCGTFLTFSDYMRNAIRLAALMRLHVIYQFTHDSIFLGEDGPTHQPVEHLAALRAMPNLVVIRPGDNRETKGAWFAALKQRTPVALILSRLAVSDVAGTIPDSVGYGAYVVKQESRPAIDACILATGSELELAVSAATVLEESGYSVRVVSFPSWELFDHQPQAYQDSVLGGNVRQYWVIEAQTSFGWHKYIGRDGHTITVEGFGKSAPKAALAEEYGFTVEKIVSKIKTSLSSQK